MDEFDRITFDPAILGGRACIRGMRIPVSVIVGQIANGATVEQVLAELPDLEEQDVRQALQYAEWLASSPEQIAAAWQEEIVRRVESIEDGTAVLIDGQDVSARIRSKYAR